MPRSGRRLRGWVLRLVLNRPAAITLGVLLALPSIWLMSVRYAWENALTSGIGLVLGATGIALLLAGLGGRRGDWVE
jgi:hypothetical protein